MPTQSELAFLRVVNKSLLALAGVAFAYWVIATIFTAAS